jgi:hypothetical protein
MPSVDCVDNILTAAEVARKLQVNERTLRKLARELGACSEIGKALLFTPADVARIMEATRCRSKSSFAAKPEAVPGNETGEGTGHLELGGGICVRVTTTSGGARLLYVFDRRPDLGSIVCHMVTDKLSQTVVLNQPDQDLFGALVTSAAAASRNASKSSGAP